MLQTPHTAVAAALLLIYWTKPMRDLNTGFSAAVWEASFYTAETDAKNPIDFITVLWLLGSWPEEQRNKEN